MWRDKERGKVVSERWRIQFSKVIAVQRSILRSSRTQVRPTSRLTILVVSVVDIYSEDNGGHIHNTEALFPAPRFPFTYCLWGRREEREGDE